MPFSIVTLVKGRKKQLENMLQSIRQSSVKPEEVIIVWMEAQTEQSTVEDPELLLKQVYLEGHHLPLSEARNLGFKQASNDMIVFLDVDCICGPRLLEKLIAKADDKTITSAPARYLPFVPLSGDYGTVAKSACTHPKRVLLETNTPLPYKNFWSLVFAITTETFNLIGGFDENFTGYGGEDTDFAERFNQKGIRFIFVDDEVLHQYHHKYMPPLNYLEAIVDNANYFNRKHDYFPMYRWLQTFCDMGYITYKQDQNTFETIALPSQKDINSTLSTLPY